jgi:hypothetical protein
VNLENLDRPSGQKSKTFAELAKVMFAGRIWLILGVNEEIYQYFQLVGAHCREFRRIVRRRETKKPLSFDMCVPPFFRRFPVEGVAMPRDPLPGASDSSGRERGEARPEKDAFTTVGC